MLSCRVCFILFICQWAAEDLLRRSEGKQKMYKSSGQKKKYILPLTLTVVSHKSMCFHTATYRSFLSFCDRDGRQRSIPSGPFWQIEWREYNLLFLEGLPCGKRVRPMSYWVSFSFSLAESLSVWQSHFQFGSQFQFGRVTFNLLSFYIIYSTSAFI